MRNHPVLQHVRHHVWLWVIGFLTLGAVFANFGPWFGDMVKTTNALATLLYLMAGVLIMMHSQGTDPLAVLEDEPIEDEEPGEVVAAPPTVVSPTAVPLTAVPPTAAAEQPSTVSSTTVFTPSSAAPGSKRIL